MDDEELKEGLKKSMSEPAKKGNRYRNMGLTSKDILNENKRHERSEENQNQELMEWNSKFDRNRG